MSIDNISSEKNMHCIFIIFIQWMRMMFSLSVIADMFFRLSIVAMVVAMDAAVAETMFESSSLCCLFI